MQDLFQETWLRAVRALPGKSKIKNFKHYIFTIATNLYRDELRKLRVRRFFLGEEADPDKDGYLYAENTVSDSLSGFKNIEQWAGYSSGPQVLNATATSRIQSVLYSGFIDSGNHCNSKKKTRYSQGHSFPGCAKN